MARSTETPYLCDPVLETLTLSFRIAPVNALPNYEHAIIEDGKRTGYALNASSERGRHEARVFENALGFNVSNWQQLKEAILGALPQCEAEFMSETVFGRKYEVVVPITGPNGRMVEVMTVWQFDRQPNETFAAAPRLVTLYVL